MEMKAVNSNSKRGRKQKQIVFSTSLAVSSPGETLEEKIILKLPITLERIKFLNNQKTSDNYQAFIPESRGITIAQKTYKYKGTSKQGDSLIKTTVYDCINILPVEISKEKIETVKKDIKTDIHCFWCTYTFDTQPVCMPESYDGKKDIFKVFGCFCSFNCSLSFAMKHRKLGHQALISHMHKKFTGKFMTIKKAPPPYCLEKYGGPVSIEDYRDSFRTGRDITINTFPMIFVPWQIEDSVSSEMLKSNVNKFEKDNEEPSSIFPKKNTRISEKKKKNEGGDDKKCDSVLFRLSCK
jgi:hypothetical protein